MNPEPGQGRGGQVDASGIPDSPEGPGGLITSSPVGIAGYKFFGASVSFYPKFFSPEVL